MRIIKTSLSHHQNPTKFNHLTNTDTNTDTDTDTDNTNTTDTNTPHLFLFPQKTLL